LSMWINKLVNIFIRVRDPIFSIKPGTMPSVKSTMLCVVCLGRSKRLWISLTDQRIGTKHFAVPIFCLMRWGSSLNDAARTESRGQ
jgi:hypothetical protein